MIRLYALIIFLMAIAGAVINYGGIQIGPLGGIANALMGVSVGTVAGLVVSALIEILRIVITGWKS